MAIIKNGVMALKITMLSLVDVRHLVKALDEVSFHFSSDHKNAAVVGQLGCGWSSIQYLLASSHSCFQVHVNMKMLQRFQWRSIDISNALAAFYIEMSNC